MTLASMTEAVGAKNVRTDPYQLLDQIGQALQVVEEEHFEPADQQALLEGALRGMVENLDPHSAYLSQTDLDIFEGSTSGKFGGIGVEVEFTDGDVVVIAPVEGSPADRAGIKPGDHIVALDGTPLQGEKPHKLVGMMRGEIGTELRITIRSKETQKLRDVVVKREEIVVSSVHSALLLGGIGYIRVKAFQDGTHREFLKALGALRKSTDVMNGLILDLRNNPGGLVREATAVADEFLVSGPIYSTKSRGKTLRTERAHRGGAFSRGPLVVLINEFSASAAELVAGALRDSHRAKLVGARTFGKGSVQTLIPLGHGGALKLTTALYYTPSGRTTQAVGVSPHFSVDPGYEHGPLFRVLKESDLSGHLKDAQITSSTTSGRDTTERGTPPTNEQLHLGVAREVPEDPREGPDVALRVGYDLVRGELGPK